MEWKRNSENVKVICPELNFHWYRDWALDTPRTRLWDHFHSFSLALAWEAAPEQAFEPGFPTSQQNAPKHWAIKAGTSLSPPEIHGAAGLSQLWECHCMMPGAVPSTVVTQAAQWSLGMSDDDTGSCSGL